MRTQPKVEVISSAAGYVLRVSVYRHVTTPRKITVHIESVYPLPPEEPDESADQVSKLVKLGEGKKFDISTLYPNVEVSKTD